MNEDNDTEREEHKEYEYKNIAASELIDTLMRQEDYDSLDHYLEENPELRKYIQRNYPHYFDVHELQENNNELAYYREHYTQHFIDEITKPIEESPRGELEIVEDKDVVSGRKHSDEKKRIIAS